MAALSLQGLEALVLNACRGIKDIYELTYIRKDAGTLGLVGRQPVHHEVNIYLCFPASMKIHFKLGKRIPPAARLE